MAQLRQDFEQFIRRDAVIVVVGPENADAFNRYWAAEDLPFIGLPNPDHSVAKLYGQQVRLIKLGRMPALVIVDKRGKVYYQHHGNSMRDIPENERVLALLDELNESEQG
jgi:peroxiredoxin Q/BCP